MPASLRSDRDDYSVPEYAITIKSESPITIIGIPTKALAARMILPFLGRLGESAFGAGFFSTARAGIQGRAPEILARLTEFTAIGSIGSGV